ncbi:MAG: 6-phosphogluconolactonase [Nitrospirae bacterium]|nr:6-phosphogluconolactonase [Nitrospirota bacterium]MDA1305000.1 6-phosphogluconolactonase [Nitrospirota bacterium]
MNSPTIDISPDAQSLMKAAAEHVVEQASLAIKARKRFTIALAGGSTPKSLYRLLASPEYRTCLEWENIKFFWGDERHVTPNHDESNYRMAYEAMLLPLAIPEHHIHRIHGELPKAEEAAEQYEKVLRTAFKCTGSQIPQFDLILLGMGTDGHTASLFPGTDAVHESTRWVAAPWVEKFQTFRITITPVLLSQARQTTFLIAGREKSEVLHDVLEGPFQPDFLPSQVIKPTTGHLAWFLDREAAHDLSPRLSP